MTMWQTLAGSFRHSGGKWKWFVLSVLLLISYQCWTNSDVARWSLRLCPETPPDLNRTISVSKSPLPIEELEKRYHWVLFGGHHQPEDCRAREKIAIIIPYRNRFEHLLLFIQHIHPFLRHQQRDYSIFIVEQYGNDSFNRAMLMNVGFKEALKVDRFDCFIFHDVDLLPENYLNLYECSNQPRHMSVAIDILNYTLPFENLFGGVSAMTKAQLELVNGFSNSFWGWGGEDDDMRSRILHNHMVITRRSDKIARYVMLRHQKEEPNPKRYKLLATGKKKFASDGLNSLEYTTRDFKINLLYTWILAKLERSK